MKNHFNFFRGVATSAIGRLVGSFAVIFLIGDAGQLSPIQYVCLMAITVMVAVASLMYGIELARKWQLRHKKKRPLPGQLSTRVKAHIQRRKRRARK